MLDSLDCWLVACSASLLLLRVLWLPPLLRRPELWRLEPLPLRELRALDPPDPLDPLDPPRELRELDPLDPLRELRELEPLDPLPLPLLALRPLEPLRELRALEPLDPLRELRGLDPLEALRELRPLDPLDELARVLSLSLLDPFSFLLRPRVERWPVPLPEDRFDDPRLFDRLEEPRPLVADIVHLLLFDSHAKTDLGGSGSGLALPRT